MKVVTWNVNSIRARLDRVYQWLRREQPDVVCLQETKCIDAVFPRRELELIGYNAVVHGQKTYNGVAILSPHAITDVFKGFDDNGPREDPQARLISATIEGVRVVSAYVPNGKKVGSADFRYKLSWLERLRDDILDPHQDPDEDLVVCGDFNVAPQDRDLWDEARWRDSIVAHPDVREALAYVRDFGLIDTYRQHHPDTEDAYSWWDYRRGSLERNRGLRIDFVHATAPLAARCVSASIDEEERRAHKKQKPSDHAPVLATFER